jgi:uncharacterized protein (TIGR02453 family)
MSKDLHQLPCCTHSAQSPLSITINPMQPHFTPAALKFLRSLTRNNDRDWFNANKSTYESALKAPLFEVITAINEGLRTFAPDHVREPQKCAMRIYRDIRFSPNKQPYKTHVSAWWARTGLEKTSGGGFYFQLDPTGVTVAAGAYMPEKDQLLAIRRMLLEDHEQVRQALRAKGLEPFDGLKMSRGPKGFDPTHPAADLILQRQWGLSTQLPTDLALTPALVPEVLRLFRAATPLVTLLNAPLTPKPRKPLF